MTRGLARGLTPFSALRKWGLTPLLCLVLVAPALALQEPTPAAASAVATLTDSGGCYHATAVIVHVFPACPDEPGQKALALTACHAIDVPTDPRAGEYEGPAETEFRLRFSDGSEAAGCRVLLRDPDNDLATLLIDAPPGLVPLRVAAAVRVGDPVTIDARKLFDIDAGPGTVDATARRGRRLMINARCRRGNSGGAILNTDGELVGVLLGAYEWTDDEPWGQPTVAAAPGPIHNLLSASILHAQR